MNRFNSLVTRAAVVIVLFAGPGPQGCYNPADYGAVPNAGAARHADGQRHRALLPVEGKRPQNFGSARSRRTTDEPKGPMQNELDHGVAHVRAPVAG